MDPIIVVAKFEVRNCNDEADYKQNGAYLIF